MKYFKASDEWTGMYGPMFFRSEDGTTLEYLNVEGDWAAFNLNVEQTTWAYTDDEDDRVSFEEVEESELPAGAPR